MSVISFAQAKQLILARLRDERGAMPVSERDRPRYMIADPRTGILTPLSINNLIVQVQMETELGRSYVYSEAANLGYAVA